MALVQPDGVLLLDKPPGYSSTQALARSKRMLAARKAGHTGTLDPFATGLLPLVFGEATKFSRFLIDSTKSYRATLDLGVTSTTGDPEGSLSPRQPPCSDVPAIDDVLAGFVGVRDQIPPMHSAVHHEGRRLYDLAREGLQVERTPRRIEILHLRRASLDGSALQVDVTCSKGTYVRTLAIEIGEALGCGAYLIALRRTAVGRFRLEQAFSLEALEAAGVEGARASLLPVEVLVAGLARWDAPADTALRFTQGQVVEGAGARPGEERAVFDPAGRFLGVGRAGDHGTLAPERLMATGGPAKLPDFA
ncbi:MAG TPA: tRNA pseudouridine(55) synthase TruB [Usitatibacter sp.]|nr:tRNA pseudouridine(55) synthase TruB [Usitatibacter sp.]